MASMTKVTLAKSIRLPGDRLRRVGEVVEVSDEVHERFAQLGVFDSGDPAPVPVKPEAPADERVAEPDAPVVKRPARTAPVDTWRAYAEAQGIDPKGMSKAELIAATN